MPSTPTPADASRDAGDALPVGTRLGEFELRAVLGVGGFGIVYRAWDQALEREVALKEYMPAALAARGKGVHVSLRSAAHAETFAVGLRSFVNEARMLARFDHAALVKVYRFWEGHGTAYMVMPYYRGRTLRQVRQAMEEPPDEAACRRIVDPLLCALELLHHQDVYHRDIAPDNIVVGDDGTPVLLDFGAARRALGDRTQSLTAILKPNFAPLEQYADVSSMRQGPWTDLYGLAATVYYFITGQSPMPAAARALHDELTPLTHIEPPGCTAEFLAGIDWALALRPPDRPQSVVVLRDVLEGRMAVPATVRRDVTMPGVTARGIGGWSAQSMGPTVTLPLPGTAALASEPAAVPRVVPADMPVMPSPVPRPVGAARQGRVPLIASAGAAVLAAALWWGIALQAPPQAAAASATTEDAAQAAAPTTAEPGLAGPQADAMPRADEPPAVEPSRAAAATRRVVNRSAAVTDPRQVCGSRRFIAFVACVKRECERPELSQHPECRRMAALEGPEPQP